MKVEVEFLAQLRAAAGCPEISVEVREGATVLELIADLARAHGTPFGDLALTVDGAPQPGLLVAVDGVRVADPAAQALRPGAQVILGTAIAGG